MTSLRLDNKLKESRLALQRPTVLTRTYIQCGSCSTNLRRLGISLLDVDLTASLQVVRSQHRTSCSPASPGRRELFKLGHFRPLSVCLPVQGSQRRGIRPEAADVSKGAAGALP